MQRKCDQKEFGCFVDCWLYLQINVCSTTQCLNFERGKFTWLPLHFLHLQWPWLLALLRWTFGSVLPLVTGVVCYVSHSIIGPSSCSVRALMVAVWEVCCALSGWNDRKNSHVESSWRLIKLPHSTSFLTTMEYCSVVNRRDGVWHRYENHQRNFFISAAIMYRHHRWRLYCIVAKMSAVWEHSVRWEKLKFCTCKLILMLFFTAPPGFYAVVDGILMRR